MENLSWRALETYLLFAKKLAEQENFDMPRIPHVGEFDWGFPQITREGLLGTTSNFCLLFHLHLDNGEPLCASINESVAYLNGRNADPRRTECYGPVFPDTQARVIPEIAKVIGLAISEQDWTRGVIVSCLAGRNGQIFYLVGSDFSRDNPVEYPTKFVESVVRKVARSLKQK